MVNAVAVIGNTRDGQARPGRLEDVDFLRLLVTELRFQDPMRPLDEREFLSQLAQFASLQELRGLHQTLAAPGWQLLSLVGKDVALAGPDGLVAGTVEAVRLQPRPELVLASGSFPADWLVEVRSDG